MVEMSFGGIPVEGSDPPTVRSDAEVDQLLPDAVDAPATLFDSTAYEAVAGSEGAEALGRRLYLTSLSKTKLTVGDSADLADLSAKEYIERKQVYDLMLGFLGERFEGVALLNIPARYQRLAEIEPIRLIEDPRPDELSRDIARIQNQLDTVYLGHTEVLRIAAGYSNLLDMAEDGWQSVSNGASEASRRGEATLFLYPLKAALSELVSLRLTYEATLKRLERTYDALSRQITVLQIRVTLGEIARPAGYET